MSSFLLFMLVVLMLVPAFREWRHRRIVSVYDWLDVMSHTKWKTMRELRDELGAKKGKGIGTMESYADLEYLEEEGLIECEEKEYGIGGLSLPMSAYRLRRFGVRYRHKRHTEKADEFDWGDLQPV